MKANKGKLAPENKMNYSYEIKIPKDRIAVLIGKNGEMKKQLEESTDTKIKVDSEEGDVSISGEDAIGMYNAREIVNAIGRGFNPEVALELLKADYVFETIELMDYAKTKNDLIRLRGRVIGAEGKSRKIIGDLTETSISVYGKTISIIGQSENVAVARRAVDGLLQGSTHGKIYTMLEKARREIKMRRIGI